MMKIFDFNAEKTPAGTVGKVRELAWPCKMFRVTLPQYKKGEGREFNIFERCVLKLLSCARYEPKDLAEETCLPGDVIQAILLRLYDSSMIDENNQLSDGAREKLRDMDNDSIPAEYLTYAVFRERVGNEFLPMLIDANLPAEEVSDDGSSIKKGEKELKLYEIRVDKRGVQNNISIENIVSILNAMNRRRNFAGGAYHIPKAKFISISQHSENCKLRVRMALQKNGDWRILNPFGAGWSSELESVYTKLLAQNGGERENLKKWQESNKQCRQSPKKNPEKTPQPFDTPENRSDYPELIAALSRREMDVYAALEWALFYALQRVDVKKFIHLFQIGTGGESESFLANAIRDLTGGEMRAIHAPRPGKLKSFTDGKIAEMQVVLPLAILCARENPLFSFNRALKARPECLSKIYGLKERRDAKRHGKNKWSEIYNEEDYEFMRDFITLLLPTVIFSDSGANKNSDENESIDIRLQARISLQNEFGVYEFNSMDNILQEKLISAEIFKQDYANVKGEFDALSGINHLYAAVQRAFHLALAVAGNIAGRGASMEMAKQKAMDVGFNEFPASLSTVRHEMVQKTLDGDDQTLGACVIAWLLLSDIDVLRKARLRCPSLLNDADRLLNLNKHANQTCIMDEDMLKDIYTSIYKIIKTIMEK